MILDNFEDKNPKDQSGSTPLHYAAQNGHYELCALIMEKIQDKNPPNEFGITPLDLAHHMNHVETCKLIAKQIIWLIKL